MIPDLAGGGAEKVLVNLVNNMDRSKFDITVKTIFDVGVNRERLLPHIRREYCIKKQFRGNSKLFTLFTPEMLFKRFIKGHYNIIVSYLEGSTARIVSGCKDSNTKLVSWIHVEQHNKNVFSASFRSYEEAKRCYNKFNRIICVSEFVKSDFSTLLGDNTPIYVLHNTIETEKIHGRAIESIDDYVLDKNIKTMIGIGTLKQSKCFDRLIRIHARLRDSGLFTRLLILGTGCEHTHLLNLITELGVNDSCCLLGYKQNPYKYIKACDLFVCSSISEGFSTAATEALIVGTPVVTVEVSGMKEMLGEHNEYGIVTENSEEALYEGIRTMLTTPGMLEDYAQRAKQRGKEFSTEKTVRAVEDMLLNL